VGVTTTGTASPGAAPTDPALRARPQQTRDTVWWFDALREHRLLIQRCTGCGRLRHPVGPMCPACRSLDWDTVEASGRGSVHAFVVSHHPQLPGFDYPLVTALVDLEEGTRLLANVVGCDPSEVRIGSALRMEWLDIDAERAFPQFRLAAVPA
jgi:uncharacterized OB-fold protein